MVISVITGTSVLYSQDMTSSQPEMKQCIVCGRMLNAIAAKAAGGSGRYCSKSCLSYKGVNINGSRRCPHCDQTLPLTQFYVNRSKSSTGFQTYCKKCINARYADYQKRYRDSHRQEARDRAKAWNDSHSEHRRNWHLFKNFGVSHDWYEKTLADQGGGCAICGSKTSRGNRKYLHVDHDHATGKVRGLLCGPCNRGIGQLGDDIELLKAAIGYLESHR